MALSVYLPLIKFNKNIATESLDAFYFLTIHNSRDTQPIVHRGSVVALLPMGWTSIPSRVPTTGKQLCRRKSRKC